MERVAAGGLDFVWNIDSFAAVVVGSFVDFVGPFAAGSAAVVAVVEPEPSFVSVASFVGAFAGLIFGSASCPLDFVAVQLERKD